MRRKIGIMTLLVVFVFLGGGLFAQEQTGILEKLQERLQEQDWSEEEIGNVIRAARSFQWEGADPVHAEMIAMALQLGKAEGEALGAREQAAMAHELALAAGEMKQLGFQNREIARTALESTRQMFQDLRQVRTGDEPGQVPEDALVVKLQERVQSRLRNQVHEDDQLKVRERAADAEGLSHDMERPGNGVPAQDGSGRD